MAVLGAREVRLGGGAADGGPGSGKILMKITYLHVVAHVNT